jgi:hypothetical protein
MLDFSMYQSRNPLNRLNAIFVLAVDRIAKSPYLFNWSMSCAISYVNRKLPRRRCNSSVRASVESREIGGRRKKACVRVRVRVSDLPPEILTFAIRDCSRRCTTAMKKLRIVILAKVWHGATENGP